MPLASLYVEPLPIVEHEAEEPGLAVDEGEAVLRLELTAEEVDRVAAALELFLGATDEDTMTLEELDAEDVGGFEMLLELVLGTAGADELLATLEDEVPRVLEETEAAEEVPEVELPTDEAGENAVLLVTSAVELALELVPPVREIMKAASTLDEAGSCWLVADFR